MFKFFRKIDDFLTMCEEYVEQRVWNGLFIYDLQYLQEAKTDKSKEDFEKKRDEFLASERYQNTVAFLEHVWGIIMQVPILADTLRLFCEAIRICVKYLAHYLVILIAGLVTTSYLLNIFTTSPIVFSIVFLPILLANHLLISAFFFLVEKKEHGAKITFLEAIKQTKPTMRTNSFVFLLMWSILLSFVTLFLGFSSFLSFVFGAVNIDWSNSFLYWMPIVMAGLLLSIILYLILMVVVFSFVFIIFDKKNAKQAINQSWQYVQNDPRHATVYFVILSALSFIDIVNKTATSKEGGFMVSMLYASHAFFFLGYMLRKKNFEKDVKPTESIYGKFLPPFVPLVGFGLLSYVAVATFTVQQIQPEYLRMLEARRQANIIKYEYKQYTNKDSDYAIEIPKQWTPYRWSDHSVTFYTNDNGTDAGNIRIDIDVKPDNGNTFQELYDASPGLITYDTGSKNSTTKIANITIADEKAVKYSYTKIEGGKPEYQTHYLIRHNKQLFNISFAINNKNYEENYRDVFNTIITSFQFLK